MTLPTDRSTLIVEVASGSTRPEIAGGRRSLRSALSSSAGSEASEERVPTATIWAGATAQAKRAIEIRPSSAVNG